jgi:hypothetical protein
LARVDFDCTNDSNEVTVTWTVVADTNLVRAFALDIICDVDIDKDSFTGLDPNYWVYPGSIDINTTTGQVDANGNPVCTDPCDGTELEPNSATIEMGSLYKGDANKPLSSGTVCKFKVKVSTGDVNVTLAENAIRAGVVMEDANNDDANLPQTWTLSIGVPDCFPQGPEYSTQRGYWESFGKPDCWCGTGTGAVSDGFQCHGDADGKKSVAPFFRRVYIGDISTITANWKLKDSDWNSSDPLGTTPGNLNPCADVDHKKSVAPFFRRVYIGDISRATTNWKAKDSDFSSGANCPLTDAANNTYVDPT